MIDQVFEFRWKDEKTPYFRVIRNGMLSEQAALFGMNISIEVTGMYSCSGYEKDGVYHPCVSGGAPGTKKCEECKKQEGMPIAQYCDGFNTDMFSGEEIESLSYPHYVYMAFFDRNLVKIGVSASGRGYLRQIEQGSHYCSVIAKGMWGVPARQMETLIRREGMVDKVQASQKKNLMFLDVKKEEAKKILEDLSEKFIPSVIAQKPELEQYLQKPPEFMDFSSVYHLSTAEAIEKPMHYTDLIPGESLSGTLISAKGNFLLLETDSEKILINAKKLKGYQVDFSAKPIGLQKEDAFQGALF